MGATLHCDVQSITIHTIIMLIYCRDRAGLSNPQDSIEIDIMI